mmetsp:Transcript_1831/g.6503  ORF Transcript_1831/g.6503 Transcript_1831/m.6503 type:complete len:229 (+) Transcript_1831:1170-1856(+)
MSPIGSFDILSGGVRPSGGEEAGFGVLIVHLIGKICNILSGSSPALTLNVYQWFETVVEEGVNLVEIVDVEFVGDTLLHTFHLKVEPLHPGSGANIRRQGEIVFVFANLCDTLQISTLKRTGEAQHIFQISLHIFKHLLSFAIHQQFLHFLLLLHNLRRVTTHFPLMTLNLEFILLLLCGMSLHFQGGNTIFDECGIVERFRFGWRRVVVDNALFERRTCVNTGKIGF